MQGCLNLSLIQDFLKTYLTTYDENNFLIEFKEWIAFRNNLYLWKTIESYFLVDP